MARVFVSHAEADRPLIEAFVDLLQMGLDISRKDIFCTSIEGMKIRQGKPFVPYIKDELTSSDYVIMIVTAAYYESAFCLCELGATWVLGHEASPLLVKPIDYSQLKAVLTGVQAGKIDDKDALNQMKDQLQEAGFGNPSTGRWESKRDTFLRNLSGILPKLPGRSVVSANEHETLKATYNATQDVVQDQQKKIESLNHTIENLKACKDKEEVAAVLRADMTELDKFEAMAEDFREAVKALPRVVIEAMYQTQDGTMYVPDSGFGTEHIWDPIYAARERGLLIVDHDVKPNEESPKVRRALAKLDKIREFVKGVDSEFAMYIETTYDFQCSLAVRDFWEEFLGL